MIDRPIEQRDLDNIWARPSETGFRASHRTRCAVSPLRASIQRAARNPEVIAAILMIAICVGTFAKIYLDTGRL